MKLGYEFKQYDYVVCTGLDEEQITAILNRMVECGATLYDTYENCVDAFDTLYWDAGGDTYFEEANYWSGSDVPTEIKWEDIVKTEVKTKTLREMYPKGMYTDNSPEVFERFKELLEGDVDTDDENNYYGSYQRCGLDAECQSSLVQYDVSGYGKDSVYLTNEEFFAITLDETIKLPSGDSIQCEGSDDSVTSIIPTKPTEDEVGTSSGLGADVVPPQSIGQLIEQIQINTYPNSPRVVIDSDGNPLLRGAGIKVSVSGKSAEDIDKIYLALCILMQEV